MGISLRDGNLKRILWSGLGIGKSEEGRVACPSKPCEDGGVSNELSKRARRNSKFSKTAQHIRRGSINLLNDEKNFLKTNHPHLASSQCVSAVHYFRPRLANANELR